MDHIVQLKKIRSDAIERLRSSGDFKLAGKLGVLIAELGESVEDTVVFGDAMAEMRKATDTPAKHQRPYEAASTNSRMSDAVGLKEEDIVEEMVAELEDETNENDASQAPDNEHPGKDVLNSIFSRRDGESRVPNGSAH